MFASSLAVLGLAATGCGAGGGGGGEDGKVFRRPVDLVVPFGPGGGADQIARTAGLAMEKEIDQKIPVVNVPGATGNTGMTKMLASRPGSSMAILIQDTFTSVPAGASSFELDDIRAACRLQSMPSALFVKKDTYADWEELAAEAKSKPGEVKVATVGANSVDDIVLGALAENVDTEFRAVPFSSPSERYAALLGGGVDVLYEQLGDVVQYLDSGDFVPVLLVADGPAKGYEDLPTTTDIGLPEEIVLPQFRGIVVSADTSDEIVDALSDACKEAVETPKMKDFQTEVYATDDSYQSAEEFHDFLETQESLIAKQLKAYGIVGG